MPSLQAFPHFVVLILALFQLSFSLATNDHYHSLHLFATEPITSDPGEHKCTDSDCQDMMKASVCNTDTGDCSCRIGDHVTGSLDGNSTCTTITCHSTADCYPKSQPTPSANETTIICQSDGKCVCDPARMKLAGQGTQCVPLDDGYLLGIPLVYVIAGGVLFLLLVAFLIWCAWFGPTICRKAKHSASSSGRGSKNSKKHKRSTSKNAGGSKSRKQKSSRRLKGGSSKRKRRGGSVSVSRRQKQGATSVKRQQVE